MSDLDPAEMARAQRLADHMNKITDEAIGFIERFVKVMKPQPEIEAVLWEYLARKALAKIKEIKQ